MLNFSQLDIKISTYIINILRKYIGWKKRKTKIDSENSWLGLFSKDNYIIHQLGDGIKIKLYKDSVLSKFIYEDFETGEIDFLNDYLEDGDCFLDIGSNIGLFSLYASRKVGSTGLVFAFEPASLTFKRLLENVQMNEMENIRPLQMGLSDKDEILELNISADGYEAWNTFVHTTDSKFSTKEKAQVKKLDHVIKEHFINTDKIALVKLDVEGFEINVLKGASELLAGQNAPVFIVEFTDDNALNAGNCCHELYKMLLQYDYTWYTFDPVKKELNEDPMRLNYPYVNLIAIKNAEKNKRISRYFKKHL